MPWALAASTEIPTSDLWRQAVAGMEEALVVDPAHTTVVMHPSMLLHRGSRHSHTAFMAIPGMGKPKPVPESTTAADEGSAPTPNKPQKALIPPPGHPLFMQPPAVRAALFASISKKKMYEAREHSDIARQESDKADDAWRKSLEFATKAAAYRDACVKYQLHAGMIHSLNRLIGFSTRSSAMIEAGQPPLGSQPVELMQAGNMAFQAHKQLERANSDVTYLEKLVERLKEADGFDKFAPKVERPLQKLVDQRDRLKEIYDNLAHVEATLKAQVPETHGAPILPERLLRPHGDPDAGDPWWPEKPPKPVIGGKGASRLMLLKAFNPAAGLAPVHGGAGAMFL